MNTLTKTRTTLMSSFQAACWWFLIANFIGFAFAIVASLTPVPFSSFAFNVGGLIGVAIPVCFFAYAWYRYDETPFWVGFMFYGVAATLLITGLIPLFAKKEWHLSTSFYLILQMGTLVPLYRLTRQRALSSPRVLAYAAQSSQKIKHQSVETEGEGGGIKYQAVHPTITFDNIFGMAETKTRLQKAGLEIVDSIRANGKLKARNGIMLSGSPGNGKTVFAEALAGELGIPLLSVTYGDVASKYVNETTQNVVKVFRDARSQAPCVLFLDEIDSLISKRDGRGSSDNETAKTTNTILTEIINIRNSGVVVMAATNFLDRLDQAAIREGRFDYKIEVPPPDQEARYLLLQDSLWDLESIVDIDMDSVKRASERWEGYSVKRILAVGEELVSMHGEMVMEYIDLSVIMVALRRVQGRKGRISPDTKSIEELILPAELRQQLKTIAARMKDIERVERLGGTVPTGLLFFGEPGTGKTETARSLAKETDWAFLNTSGNDLIMKSGEMDRLVAEAADIRPCIVFIDEADDILANRKASNVTSITNKLLAAMDGAQGKVRDVVYIAATNHPDHIDPAALRGRRFTEKLFFPLPDAAGLAQFVAMWMKKTPAIFSADLTPQAIADMIGNEVSIANAGAILQESVNTMIGRSVDDGNDQVSEADMRSALRTILG